MEKGGGGSTFLAPQKGGLYQEIRQSKGKGSSKFRQSLCMIVYFHQDIAKIQNIWQ